VDGKADKLEEDTWTTTCSLDGSVGIRTEQIGWYGVVDALLMDGMVVALPSGRG